MSLIALQPFNDLLPARRARERLRWFLFRSYVFVSLFPLYQNATN